MFERRLPLDRVDQLMAEGKSMSETARLLGFSKQAVSKALQKRKGASERTPVKAGPKAVSEFEGLKRLKKLMEPVFQEIRFLNSEIEKLKDEQIKGEDR